MVRMRPQPGAAQRTGLQIAGLLQPEENRSLHGLDLHGLDGDGFDRLDGRRFPAQKRLFANQAGSPAEPLRQSIHRYLALHLPECHAVRQGWHVTIYDQL